MKRVGIRARGTVLVVLAVAFIWTLAAVLTWRNAEHEAAEIFDGHLAQAASMLIAQTAIEIEEDDDGDEQHAPVPHRYARKVAFQVWKEGRELLVHSENAPSTRLGTIEEGFSDSLVEGQAWRVFSAWNARRGLLVQVGERSEARQEMAEELAVGLLKPLLWALPLLAALIWLALGQAVRPLRALAGEIAHRSPDRLEAVTGLPVPEEVGPLVERLNELLARVDQALQSEKRFTGDAAHELRTPIAALAAQAEVALAASEEAERRHALEAVLAAARRMARLVEQMLTLARVDSALPAAWPAVDLAAIVREVIAERAPEAIARGVDIGLEAPAAAPVRGEAGWLAILVRNLVDNALRHSPAGSTVELAIAGEDGGVVFEVVDGGEGLPDELLGRLGQRFWRGPAAAAQGPGGSGLGLSIVRRIAELHGAHLGFDNRSGAGLRVRLRLPPA